GSFVFSTQVESDATYAVTVHTQPGNPTQTCTVANGSGTVSSTDITHVEVTCSTNTYTVGGTLSGLSGSGLVLRNNGGDDLALGGNGSFVFSTQVESDATYAVTVHTQPGNPTQTCTVANGSGTVSSADITHVEVTCSTNTYTVGGTLSGLSGSGLVLRNNGGDDLGLGSNGSFVFSAPVASGATYAVTVHTQPGSPTQTCTVANGSGTVSSADITHVEVTCSTNTYTVGGTLSGLSGSGLVLRNNGGDDLGLGSNGSFVFSAPVASGATYAVTVHTQPGSPAQTCTVANGSGTVTTANISTVAVSCSNDPIAPSAPRNVRFTPSGSDLVVAWDAPASDGGRPITGYTVTLAPGGRSCSVTGNPPPTRCTISQLTPGQYSVAVSASNAVGSGTAATATGVFAPSTPVTIPATSTWALMALMLATLGLAGAVLARRS
ncbi:fibronectin type III domain-containing protein, partial [Pseudomarimonas salicorniae]